MAIFHFSAKVISRKSGQSVIAKAAYNAREELTEERTGEVKDYRRAEGLTFSGIYTPAHAPAWAQDRAKLWNAADRAERHPAATLAREYEVALPHELTDAQRRYLVQDFVKESFTRKGYAADVSIHAPDREGDKRNHHAHILVTDRRLEADGFAATKYDRQGKSQERKAELEALREKWEKTTNRHLERHGIDARIDRRSLKDQGIDREPTQHQGPYATQLERYGQRSERGELNREIEARNAERKQLKKQERQAQTEYEDAQREQENEQEQDENFAQDAVEKDEEKKPRREQDESLSGFAGRALDQITDEIQGFIFWFSDLFSTPDPPPRPAKQERGPTPKQRRGRDVANNPRNPPQENDRARAAAPPPEPERKPEPEPEREPPAPALPGPLPPLEGQAGYRVIDRDSGTASRPEEFAIALLEGLEKPSQEVFEGFAHILPTKPDPKPRLHRRERGPTPDQIRAREQALANLHRSLQQGNDLDAADLRNLDRAHLEGIRASGDEYLQNLMQRWEREQQERERERENDRER